MHHTKRAIFIGGGLMIAALALVMVFSGGNNNQAEALTSPIDQYYLCYATTGAMDAPDQTVTTKFGADEEVLGVADQYCELSLKDGNGNLLLDDLACYGVTDGFDPPVSVDLKTQFHKLELAEVQVAQRVCITVEKAGGLENNAAVECFDIKGAGVVANVNVTAVTDNVTTDLSLSRGVSLCVGADLDPSTQNSDLEDTLVCYEAKEKGDPTVPRNVTTLTNKFTNETFALTEVVSLCVWGTQTIKVDGTGNLSGIGNIQVHGGACAPGTADCGLAQGGVFFYCKSRTDHDSTVIGTGGAQAIKTAAVCFVDVAGQGDPASAIPDDPNVDLDGPPPPPPYGDGAPFKGAGIYCADGGCAHPAALKGGEAAPTPNPKSVPYPATMLVDQLVSISCVESLGGALGPNVINVLTMNNAKATLPNQSGFVDIYYGQSTADCNDLNPNGSPTITLPTNVDTYDTPPYDKITSVDSDGDGCADAFELDKNRPNKDCGDDPWNPHDSDLNFTGIFTITVEVLRADTCLAGEPAGPPPIGCTGQPDKQLAAGSYFSCQADLVHDKGDNSINGRAWCYTDNPITTVNIENVGDLIDTFAGTPTPVTAVACNPIVPGGAPQDLCGDGLSGAAPPGPMGDNDGDDPGPGTITGFLDKDKNKLILDACFEGIENPTQGPVIYARIEVDAHTGLGTVDIWLNQSDCTKPTGNPDTNDAGVAIGEQDSDYDVDQDGCTTTQELGPNPDLGGQRDPYNKYDHMDINKDGAINIPNDILAVALLFGPQPTMPQGDVGPTMNGSVQWAHEQADGTVNIPDDILGMAAMFGQNC